MKRLLILLVVLFLLTSHVAYAEPDREIMRLGRGTATSLAWRPDGKVVAVGGSAGVWFFDDQLQQIQHIDDNNIQSVQWSTNGKKITNQQ